MDTLMDRRVAEVLQKLHRDGEAADSALFGEVMEELAASGGTADDAAAKLIADERMNYRAIYRGYADNFLNVSPDFGRFIYSVARLGKATRIVEFGTSMGISAIYLAAAIRDNGGGRLMGTELEPSKVSQARANLEAAGLADLVDIREGDALQTLGNVEAGIDMLLLDGAFSLYLPVLKLVEPKLKNGAIVLGENAFDSDYLAYVRNAANGYTSQRLPFDEGRGNEFSVRTR